MYYNIMSVNLENNLNELRKKLNEAERKYISAKKNNNGIETPEIIQLKCELVEALNDFRTFKNKHDIFLNERKKTEKPKELLGWIIIGQYKISLSCEESFPCVHKICFPDGKIENLNASDIDELLQKDNLFHPHFNGWKKFQDLSKQDMKRYIESKKEERKNKENTLSISSCFSCDNQ